MPQRLRPQHRRVLVWVPEVTLRRYLAVLLLAALTAAITTVTPAAPVSAQAQTAQYKPLLYTTPSCLSGGETTVHVHGRNFDRNAPVDVWDLYGTGDWAYGNYEPTTTDDFGGFEVDVPINKHTNSEVHSIVAPYANQYVQQAKVIVALCDYGQRLSANPQCRTPGMTDVVVSWSGFLGSGPAITFNLYDLADPATSLASMTLDPFSAGEHEFPFTQYPNGLPDGQYRIAALQQSNDPPVYILAETFIVVPCPTVTLQPTCASSGGPPDEWSIDVTATGFSDWFWVEIVFDSSGRPQEYWTENGTTTITPYRRAAGQHTVLVKQGYYEGYYFAYDTGADIRPSWTDQQVQAVETTFTDPCPASPPPSAPPTTTPSATPTATPATNASVTADPTCGPAQLEGDVPLSTFVTVSGGGFEPGAVTVTYDPGGANEQTFGVEALVDGTFLRALPIRGGRDGVFRILAQQDAGGLDRYAETIFTVPCSPPDAALTIDPSCGVSAADVGLAYLVSLSGTGFLPGHVDISFDAASLAPASMPPAVADAAGNFSALIAAPGRGPGTYLISARQHVIGSDLAVESTAEFKVACEGPTFQLLPNSGPRGFVLSVVGHNFPPETDLSLHWDTGINSSRSYMAHTDANGDFTRQVLIFNSDFTGPRQMTIVLASDPLVLAGLPAADFMVTAGTVSPPFSLTDNPYAGPGATIVIRH